MMNSIEEENESDSEEEVEGDDFHAMRMQATRTTCIRI